MRFRYALPPHPRSEVGRGIAGDRTGVHREGPKGEGEGQEEEGGRPSPKGKPPSLTGRRLFSHCLFNQVLYRFRLAAFSSQPFRHVRGEGDIQPCGVYPPRASGAAVGLLSQPLLRFPEL